MYAVVIERLRGGFETSQLMGKGQSCYDISSRPSRNKISQKKIPIRIRQSVSFVQHRERPGVRARVCVCLGLEMEDGRPGWSLLDVYSTGHHWSWPATVRWGLAASRPMPRPISRVVPEALALFSSVWVFLFFNANDSAGPVFSLSLCVCVGP